MLSTYADAAAMFIKPTVEDLQAVKLALQIFGDASGLVTNLEKTQVSPIRCENHDITAIIGSTL